MASNVREENVRDTASVVEALDRGEISLAPAHNRPIVSRLCTSDVTASSEAPRRLLLLTNLTASARRLGSSRSGLSTPPSEVVDRQPRLTVPVAHGE